MKDTIVNESTIVEEKALIINDSEALKPKKIKIETPIGSVESDSGSHTIDILSVVIIIGLLYIGKKIFNKWTK